MNTRTINKIFFNRRNMVGIGLVFLGLAVAIYIIWVYVPKYIFVTGTFSSSQLGLLPEEENGAIHATSTPQYYMIEFVVNGQKAQVDKVDADSIVNFATPVQLSRGFGEVAIPFTLVWYSPVQDKAWRLSETFTFKSRSIKKSLIGNELGLNIHLNGQNRIRISPVKYNPPNLIQQINSIGATTGAYGYDTLIRNQPVDVVELSQEETEAIKKGLDLVGITSE